MKSRVEGQKKNAMQVCRVDKLTSVQLKVGVLKNKKVSTKDSPKWLDVLFFVSQWANSETHVFSGFFKKVLSPFGKRRNDTAQQLTVYCDVYKSHWDGLFDIFLAELCTFAPHQSQ